VELSAHFVLILYRSCLLLVAPYESISQGDSDNEEAYDDEFDVYDDLERLQSEVPTQIISTCEVLYDFNSTQSTELTIRQGMTTHKYTVTIFQFILLFYAITGPPK